MLFLIFTQNGFHALLVTPEGETISGGCCCIPVSQQSRHTGLPASQARRGKLTRHGSMWGAWRDPPMLRNNRHPSLELLLGAGGTKGRSPRGRHRNSGSHLPQTKQPLTLQPKASLESISHQNPSSCTQKVAKVRTRSL